MKNRKLRLVITAKCHNKCPMCCNNRFNLNELPVVDRLDYDEVMITGGEPLLFPSQVQMLVGNIRGAAEIQGYKPKVYIYTAIPNHQAVIRGIYCADGVVVTPHNKREVDEFIKLNQYLFDNLYLSSAKSLRLNLFSDIAEMLPKDINLSLWSVKHMEWIKDCPIPEGEDLRRINELL